MLKYFAQAIIFGILFFSLLGSSNFTQAYAAECGPLGFSVSITSGPYALIDAKTPGVKGPSVVTLSATITNTGPETVSNILVHIGDGQTPGNFQEANGKKLALLAGATDATRHLGQIASRQSRAFFWQVFYPATGGVEYPYKIWVRADECVAAATATLKIRSSGPATTNRLSKGTMSLFPESGKVGPGQTLTVTVKGFDFGFVGNGVNGEESAWLQPIGNSDFDPTCFRLIQTEVFLKALHAHSILNQLYFKKIGSANPLPNYDNKSEDYVKYIFIALRDCSTSILPYQQAATSNDEKYNGDYGLHQQKIMGDKKQGSLILNKIVNPPGAEAGSIVSETIFFGNLSNASIGDPSNGGPVSLLEVLPASVSYIANSMYCGVECLKYWSTDGGKTFVGKEPAKPETVNALKWVLTQSVKPREEMAGTVGFQIKIKEANEICTKVSGRIGDGPTLIEETACINSQADLILEQSGPTTILPGASVEYIVGYGNAGPSAAEDVVITDVIPPGATFLSATPEPDKISTDRKTLTFNIGSIPAKQTGTIAIRLTADSDLSIGTALTNTAQGLMSTSEKNTQNNVSVLAPLVLASTAPSLRATETVSIVDDISPSGPSAGDTLEYLITISNKGSASATSVLFRHPLAPSVKLLATSVTTSRGAVLSNTTNKGVTVRVGLVGPSEPVIIKFRGQLARPLAREVERIAGQGFISSNELATIVTDDPNTPVLSDATLLYLAQRPLISAYRAMALLEDSDHNLIVSAGDTLQYTITLLNRGNANAEGIAYSDLLGIGLRIVPGSVNASQGEILPSDGWVKVNLGTLPATSKATIVYKVKVAPLPAGLKQMMGQGIVSGENFASMLTDDPFTPGLDDPTIVSVTAAAVVKAYLATHLMTDADGDGKPSEGDTLLYRATLVNLSETPARNVSFANTPDAHGPLVFGSVGLSQGAIRLGNQPNANAVQASIETLLGRSTSEITFETVIGPNKPSKLSTQAIITGQNFANLLSDDPDTPSFTDTTETLLASAPELKIFQRDALWQDLDKNEVISAGDTVLYTITVTNMGQALAEGAVYSTLPDPNTRAMSENILTDQGEVTLGKEANDTSIRVAIGKLGPGETVRLSFQVEVNKPLASGVTRLALLGLLEGSNFQTEKSDDPDTPTKGDETMTLLGASQAIISQAALKATKVDTLVLDNDQNGIADPGDLIEYKVIISNTGKGEALGVTYTDYPDPSTILIVSSVETNHGQIVNGNNPNDAFVRVNVGQISPGGQVRVVFRVAVRNFLVDGTERVLSQGIVSDVSTPATLTSDPSLAAPNSPTETLLVAAPRLRAVKQDFLSEDKDNDGRASAGDIVLYRIEIVNEGTRAALGVIYQDSVDIHTSLIAGSVTASQGDVLLGNKKEDQAIAIRLGELVPRASTKIEFRVKILGPILAGVTQLVSQGHLSGENFPTQPTEDPHITSPENPTAIWVGSGARLQGQQWARLLNDVDRNGFVSPGDTVLYAVTIKNMTMDDAHDVTYRADLDQNLDLMVGSVATSDGVVLSGNNAGDRKLEIDLGTILGKGGTASLSFQAVIAKPLRAQADQISMQGKLSSTETSESFTDNPETITRNDATELSATEAPLIQSVMSALLSEDRDGNGSPSPGDVLEYIVHIVNRGAKPATNLFYLDEITSHTSFASHAGKISQGEIAQDSKKLLAKIGTLPPRASVRLSYSIAIDKNLPLGVSQISKQGQISGDNFLAVFTQDPNDATHASPTVTTLTAFYVTCGDVDNNGSISLNDAMIAAQIALGLLAAPTPLQLEAADVAAPFGLVDTRDATIIAEIAIGVRATCPIPKKSERKGGIASVASAQISGTTIHLSIEKKQMLSGQKSTLKVSSQDKFSALQAGPNGGIKFDPKVIQVRELSSAGKYSLLAYEIDNEKGFVKFLLVALDGTSGEPGTILELEIEAVGQAGASSAITLNIDSVIDAEAKQAKAEIEPGSVLLGKSEIFSVNKVFATLKGKIVEFVAEGTGIQSVQVIVFDLRGQRIYDAQAQANMLLWNLQDNRKKGMPNGVFFYVVRVKSFDGKIFVTRIQKLGVTR
jgi:uncharacterized repeat protein (TIGR01451 family)